MDDVRSSSSQLTQALAACPPPNFCSTSTRTFCHCASPTAPPHRPLSPWRRRTPTCRSPTRRARFPWAFRPTPARIHSGTACPPGPPTTRASCTQQPESLWWWAPAALSTTSPAQNRGAQPTQQPTSASGSATAGGPKTERTRTRRPTSRLQRHHRVGALVLWCPCGLAFLSNG